ncbi:MAG: histidinol dehydrogenase [Candidatus Peregrinibacteria bacterium]
MKIFSLLTLSDQKKQNLCLRNADMQESVYSIVKDIGEAVFKNGDGALLELGKKFDGVNLSSLIVSDTEKKDAQKNISRALKNAVQKAKENIETFHTQTHFQKSNRVVTTDGVECWKEFRAVSRVGLYVPGGTAPLVSTVLMLLVPARLAGCEQIILCTPPQKRWKYRSGNTFCGRSVWRMYRYKSRWSTGYFCHGVWNRKRSQGG